jgi:UDPglucose 6-dehydrogenase
MSRVCVIGVGYVGLVTGACLADLGNQVACLDVAAEKIAKLKSGLLPIFEPGLEEIVRRNVDAGRLQFTTSYEEGLRGAEFVFIAVGTPSGVDGEADLSYVRAAVQEIARRLAGPLVIVNKSTVPIGTGDWVASIIREQRADPLTFSVVSNPEFLREGSAVRDFLNPDRVVLGSTDEEAARRVAALYAPLPARVIVTDLRTAEMIKYASNAFLATKISFINEMANICEAVGADVLEVARGMGYDKRIQSAFLSAGLGWGGSCFPKDVKALAHIASMHGCHPQLLRAVTDINYDQRRQVILKLREMLGTLRGKTVGVLGLAFKPNTDDMRDSPAVEVIHFLQNEEAQVKAYDPVAMDNARRILPTVTYCPDAYAVAEGADALILVTEWNEFRQLDMARIARSMGQPIIFDARNIYDPVQMKGLGFRYRGIGRGYEGNG